MLRKILAGLTGVGAILSWFFQESIKAWFFDKVVHVMTPWEGYIIQYGIPVVFGGACLWLLWRNSNSAAPVTALLPSTSTSDAVPDWPIRELFYHICPALKKPRTDNLCEKVGLPVRDAFSTRQLKVWGRNAAGEGRNPLVEIDRDYWQLADFTYLFLSDEDAARYLVHATHRMNNLLQYRDLQVNKSEAFRTSWTKFSECADEFISLKDAAAKVY